MADQTDLKERKAGEAGARTQPILVKVYAHPTADEDGDPIVLFNHTWHQAGKPKGKGRIRIDPDAPETPIHFQLFGAENIGLAFEDPAQEAMWVNLTECPQMMNNPPGAGQIAFGNRTPRRLEVVDGNFDQPCVIHYALRFRDRDGNSYDYDPEIQNGGGNQPIQ